MQPSYFKGFSLLELLISIFILSFGLLGMVTISIQSYKGVKDSFRSNLKISKFISNKEKSFIGP